MNIKFEAAIIELLDKGYGVVDNWLLPDEIIAIQNELLERYEKAEFKKAHVGNNADQQLVLSQRSDEIFWLNDNNAKPAEIEFLDQIERFVDYLNRTCYAGIKDYEFHYAIYEPGTFYAKHKDVFRSDDSRKFSMVLYLNQNWNKGDGGELIIYADEEVTIEPVSGRMVFFKCDLEHEVLISNFQRKSVTGWLKA